MVGMEDTAIIRRVGLGGTCHLSYRTNHNKKYWSDSLYPKPNVRSLFMLITLFFPRVAINWCLVISTAGYVFIMPAY